MGKLDGKVIIVTGASRGIGAEIARVFAAEGGKVICSARTVQEGTHPWKDPWRRPLPTFRRPVVRLQQWRQMCRCRKSVSNWCRRLDASMGRRMYW